MYYFSRYHSGPLLKNSLKARYPLKPQFIKKSGFQWHFPRDILHSLNIISDLLGWSLFNIKIYS